MIFSIAEISFIGVGVGLEDSVSLELAVQELALEFVAVLEADLAVAVLEVVMELSLIDVLANLLQPTLSLEAVISKLSLVDLLAIGRDELTLLKFIVLENPRVGGLILLEDSQPTCLIILPSSFIKSSLWPLHSSLTVLGRAHHLSDINLASFILDPELVVGKCFYVGVVGQDLACLGDVDGEGRPQ